MTLESIEGRYARPATLMEPERMVLSAWTGHIPFAFWLTEVMRPRRLVELGTHNGGSFCPFLQARSACGLEGDFFAVDHWKGDEHAGTYDEEVYSDLKRYVETRYGLRAALLRMTFDQALAHFDDGSIDLLHIDGLHTYEAVRHDFDEWLPKMSGRGVVLLHDTNVRERDFGVHRLFAELAERYPVFEFFHSHGLGVVHVGADPVPKPLALLYAGKIDQNGIAPRTYFERLGNSLVDRYYLEQLANRVEHKDNLETELASVMARKRELEAALASTSSLRPIIDGYNFQIGSQQTAAQELRQASLILSSGFFDPQAYREAAGLPGIDDLALAQHYLRSGEATGLAPSRHFDPVWYAAEYPDVVAAGLNRLLHYVTRGGSEGRLPKASPTGDA